MAQQVAPCLSLLRLWEKSATCHVISAQNLQIYAELHFGEQMCADVFFKETAQHGEKGDMSAFQNEQLYSNVTFPAVMHTTHTASTALKLLALPSSNYCVAMCQGLSLTYT